MSTQENEDEICRRHFSFSQKIGGDPCAKFLGELSMSLGAGVVVVVVEGNLVLNEHDSCQFSLGDTMCSYNPSGSGLEEFPPLYVFSVNYITPRNNRGKTTNSFELEGNIIQPPT